MNERAKNFVVGVVTGAIMGAMIFAARVKSDKGKIALNTAREEATCQDFGRHMGYDVNYSELGTCFVVMEHGVTVPLEEALVIQQLVFAHRQQMAEFKKPGPPAK